jgi:hypothetical protein
VSLHARARRPGEGPPELESIFSTGDRDVAFPHNVVNQGYDVLPSRSAKFNNRGDIPAQAAWLGKARVLHHATTVNIRGNSYRLKDKLKAGLVKPGEATTT